MIGGHPSFHNIKRQHTAEADKILDDLVNKSSGVFLWVVLACRSLLDGFADCDRISELRRSVDELPEELADMFNKMLATVKKHHKEQGAKLLRMLYLYELVRRDLEHDTPDRVYRLGIRALGIARMNEDLVELRYPHYRMSTAEEVATCSNITGRLRSRTGGLLELDSRRPCKDEHGRPLCEQLNHEACFAEEAVLAFMHKTVFDFLNERHTWSLDCLNISDARFDPDTAISLCLAPGPLLGDHGIHNTVRNLLPALFWSARADAAKESLREHILWQLLKYPASALADRLITNHPPATFLSHLATSLAAEHQVLGFLRNNAILVAERRDSISNSACQCEPLIHHVMRQQLPGRPRGGSLYGQMRKLQETLIFLLSFHEDPNMLLSIGKITPWRLWLEIHFRYIAGQDTDVSPKLNEEDMSLTLKVATAFINSGADLNVHVTEHEYTVKDYLTRVVGQQFPRVQKELREMFCLIDAEQEGVQGDRVDLPGQ